MISSENQLPEPSEGWPSPPRPETAESKPRRIGVELEFAGVPLDDAAKAVQSFWGGEIRAESRHRLFVEGGDLGAFKLELDFKPAHPSSDGPSLISASVDAEIRGLLGDIGETVLPLEIVCPPVPIDRAHELERLVEALRVAGAVSSEDSLVYAFAAQLNPEAAALDAPGILRVLRAFMLLRDWLRDEIRIEISRRFWAFARPFPSHYMRKVLDPAYRPDMDQFIADYIEANPTRNMELDLLPLLRWCDEESVVSRLPTETINKRPAFHYRLPNAHIGVAGWSLRKEWERWLKIERLSEAGPKLDALCQEWLRADESSFLNTWTPASRAIAAML